MKGKPAAFLFLGICLALAAIVLIKLIKPLILAAVFALALVTLGGISRGFRKS